MDKKSFEVSDVILPKGEKFSLVYLEKGQPIADSQRLRRRLSALIYSTHGLDDGFKYEAEKELGLDIGLQSWHKILASCELRDLLDLVTVAHRYLERQRRGDYHRYARPEEWTTTVRRIFREENIHYSVDNLGGVHFTFDAEFERNRVAAISALTVPRYANVRNEFNAVDAALSEFPPNGKQAIRNTFTAAEGLFRLIFPSSPRLTTAEINKNLSSHLQQHNSGDPTSLRATLKAVASLAGWTEAAHFYRHEPGQEEVAQPPLSLAIYLVSQGATHLRWLAEIDAASSGR